MHGLGSGNRKSISVEICYSLSGGDRYYRAENNAATVVAQLMKQYNIPISKVRTHQSWSGKYCPHRMLDEGRWNTFIERVQNPYNGSGHIAPSTPSSNNGVGVVMITVDVLRVRTGPGTNYDIVKKVYRGERYQSWGMQNDWYNVGGDQWGSGEYVGFEGGATSLLYLKSNHLHRVFSAYLIHARISGNIMIMAVNERITPITKSKGMCMNKL